MKTFKNQISVLQNAISESKRFIEKAERAIERLNSEDGCYSTKEMAAARRAALDTKRELTNVNQLTMWS